MLIPGTVLAECPPAHMPPWTALSATVPLVVNVPGSGHVLPPPPPLPAEGAACGPSSSGTRYVICRVSARSVPRSCLASESSSSGGSGHGCTASALRLPLSPAGAAGRSHSALRQANTTLRSIASLSSAWLLIPAESTPRALVWRTSGSSAASSDERVAARWARDARARAMSEVMICCAMGSASMAEGGFPELCGSCRGGKPTSVCGNRAEATQPTLMTSRCTRVDTILFVPLNTSFAPTCLAALAPLLPAAATPARYSFRLVPSPGPRAKPSPTRSRSRSRWLMLLVAPPCRLDTELEALAECEMEPMGAEDWRSWDMPELTEERRLNMVRRGSR